MELFLCVPINFPVCIEKSIQFSEKIYTYNEKIIAVHFNLNVCMSFYFTKTKRNV